MKTKTIKRKSMGILIVLALFIGGITMSFVNGYTGDDKKKWEVPETAKKMKNPVKAEKESLATGKSLYNKHCKSCHGTGGKGDGPKSKELETSCGDFTEAAFQSQTDGEIFYKTKEGRDDMPSFKKKITEDEDIWTIVNYVRTLK